MNRKVRNLLASVVLGVCLLALSFIPSFAENSANSASVGNVEAMKENVVYDFQSLSFADAPDYVNGIKSVSVNKTKWEEASSRLSLMRREAYYRNTDENKLYFDGSSDGMLKSGNILTIESEGYETLYLRVIKATADTFTVKKTDSDVETPSGPSDGINTLHVRIRGSFESALEGQKKYDAISGASTSVTTNKNSDVIVEAAVLPDGQEPKNSDWKPLSEVITVNKNRTKINIDTEACGMEGVYSVHDSSLSLSGEPLKAGSYPISVTVTDESGRTATSNELNFKVYTRTEVLAKQLKLENCKQTADGKYMYDMEPWAIASFGGENETVTVPKDIKAWYGSHTSGTYGELGYAVDGSPVQTLIVPDGCNLTLVNMKVFSSVNIVVENGGKLVLRDSSIHGNIEVKNGGKFSSNYDDYGSQFLTGSSINGQLILNDGAILENSSIYSNTNFISNGHIIRQNTNPVIVVKGKVTVDGQVFVKGDEAATGQDETTGKQFLISEHGTMSYDALVLDDELKDALQNVMDKDSLDVETLQGFTLNTHSGTGIQYLVIDGEKGRGGKVLLQNEADRKRYEELAEMYFDKYPNLIESREEGFIWADLEIRGMAKRTDQGIISIGADGMSYSDNENYKNNWSVRFSGSMYEKLYEWLQNNKDSMEEIHKFSTWQKVFDEIGGTYERVWSKEELDQGYLNN